MTMRGRGAVRNEAARLAILEATAAQLSERGWNNLTIESIAASAGVGKPTIYRWWSSKSALISDALVEGLLTVPDPVPADTGDLRADLIAWLEPTLRAAADDESMALTRYLIAAGAEDAVVGARLDRSNRSTAALAERLERARERGELDAGAHLPALADALIGTIILRVLRRTPYREGDATAVVTEMLKTPAA